MITELDVFIRNQRDTAHNEQHRTGVLRDFKARVFHSSYIRVCAPAPPKSPAQMAAIICTIILTVLFIISCVFDGE